MKKNSPILTLNDLSYSYSVHGQEQAIFKKFSLEIPSGAFICVLGTSGCGKSTLLRMMAGMIVPDSGKVMFRDKSKVGLSPEVILLTQDDTLMPWKTVEAHIVFGLRAKGFQESYLKEKTELFLRETGLLEARRKYPHELSGGMRKRVALARALAAEPQILLLDEPFGSLDIQTRRQIQRFTSELWQQTRSTIVMVTHDIQEAIRLGEKVIILGGSPCRVISELDTCFIGKEDSISAPFVKRQRELEALFSRVDTKSILTSGYS